jgi:hypothetical protein
MKSVGERFEDFVNSGAKEQYPDDRERQYAYSYGYMNSIIEILSVRVPGVAEYLENHIKEN